MSEYLSVETMKITCRLHGRANPIEGAQISEFVGCAECGAPKGFFCREWIENGRSSCASRWKAWHRSLIGKRTR